MKNKRTFYKMHGLGNDFMVVDARGQAFKPTSEQLQDWSDRRTGIGFDQCIVLEDSQKADMFMRVYNADGSAVETCGNALRCVGRLLDQDEIVVDSLAGIATVSCYDDLYAVNMGTPRFLEEGKPLDINGAPYGVDVGNPHCVFFVDNVRIVNLDVIGAKIEHHPYFPNRTNVEFVQIVDRQTIRMRVWERGTGITRACGTGATAVFAIAHHLDHVDASAQVQLDGGVLSFTQKDDGDIYMSGSAHLVYEGLLEV